MYDLLLKKLEQRKQPFEVIVTGLGFMGFGFVSASKSLPGIRVPFVLTRDVDRAKTYLTEQGFKVSTQARPARIKEWARAGGITVSDDLSLIETYPNKVVLEVTGTVAYGTEIGMRTINAGKHLVTMNPELQVTVGHSLKSMANEKGLQVTDVYGDQPGSLMRLAEYAKMMGFKIRMLGNLKRYMDVRATQAKMAPWAKDKGLAVQQTVSFTDGTKQAIEMTLVGNHTGLTTIQPGMVGPEVIRINEALEAFDWSVVPKEGAVDYVLGLDLFPGIFAVVEHPDRNQLKYLRYLGMGNGPRYVLFEPYHLCHLEVGMTIAKLLLYNQTVIENSLEPKLQTFAKAKSNLKAGDPIDGIGGDMVYGWIDRINAQSNGLPIGLATGSILKRDITQDSIISLDDVVLPDHAATRLLGLREPRLVISQKSGRTSSIPVQTSL